MSELINNQRNRINELKALLAQLQEKEDIESVKARISEAFKTVAYEDVVAAEQELIAEGTPIENMLELCDLHGSALHGLITDAGHEIPAGHPVSTYKKENRAIRIICGQIQKALHDLLLIEEPVDKQSKIAVVQMQLNELMDIEKHYTVKENVLFPYLEKYKITGPSTVMWGKDDEVRNKLKDTQLQFANLQRLASKQQTESTIESFNSAVTSITEMIQKEEEILYPMCMETFSESDWAEIYKAGRAIGFTIIDERDEWIPEGSRDLPAKILDEAGMIQLPSGKVKTADLLGIFSVLPVDLTFVDKDDTVQFFTEGPDRIFERSRAIIGRKVQYCHPPHSVAIVEKILEDFKSGKESKADFWIQLHGKFIYISYFAVRSESGEYLGTVEMSQDLSYYRALEGEKRILSYGEKEINERDKMKTEKKEEAMQQEDKTYIVYDARQDLANGIHPAEKVLSDLNNMPHGISYRLITPFPPMPLITKANAAGFRHEQIPVSETEHVTVFFR
ncbi:MAG: DUF438 domain-containing protein [Ignavibacteria bacterium]|nr:DUF438 domain-containing protein [Ignavibacteria bacterium]